MPQCCFVFTFSRISILSVVLFPVFHWRGLDFFLLNWLVRCVCCMLASSSSYLSHDESKRPTAASATTEGERSAMQWSSWALHTQTHMKRDGRGGLKDSNYQMSPFAIKTNSLDRTLRLSFGLTVTNDCVIHPPWPSPLLEALVSLTALAQSREIVSCLFLNTHLYLTAY